MRVDDSFWRYNTRIDPTKINAETKINQKQETSAESFESVLNEAEKATSVSFSKHAVSRMNEREISLSDDEMDKLNNAVETADSKGIKESLILMNNKAFIVNIPSNVVVTVLDKNDISEQKVFTNLDGAVIV